MIVTEKPAHYDGFTFIYDKNNKAMIIQFLVDMIGRYGDVMPAPPTHDNREPYLVMLTTVHDGEIHMEAPFQTTFADALIYAEGIARRGFSGVMVRAAKYADQLLADIIEVMTSTYIKETGFVYTHEDGRKVTFPGLKSKVKKT